MHDRQWIEMPAAGDPPSGEPARPKHRVPGRAILVYRGRRVYVALDEPAQVERMMRLSEVRRLDRGEVLELETAVPGMSSSANRTPDHAGLGDVISWMTTRMGIPECRACAERRTRLNRLVPWRTVKR
jgi:hypothetical protein